MIRALKFKRDIVNRLYSTNLVEKTELDVPHAPRKAEQIVADNDLAKSANRRNFFGIPLISESLEHVLGIGESEKSRSTNTDQLKKAFEQLQSFGIQPSNDSSEFRSDEKLSFQLPQLFGNVESHFYRIGQDFVDPFIKLVNKYVLSSPPKIPTKWELRSGWTRYDPVDGSTSVVPCPLEDIFCFDVEVCVKEGPQPVMATALTPKAWYSWCSEYLINPDKKRGEQVCRSDFIPLRIPGSGNAHKLVIGHNVSYDRARTYDEYGLQSSGIRFLDTMALHIVVNGMTSGQRMRKQKKDPEIDAGFSDSAKPKWLNETSMNNLNDVYQLYCKKGPLAKEKRDIFVEGSMTEIRERFDSLMTYCANDVAATSDVFKHVFPIFRTRCPHPVTLAGMLEMGSAYLPVDTSNWHHYIRNADFVANELEEEVERVLAQQAKETCQLLVDEKFKDDIWMWDQDWKCAGLRIKKGKAKLNLEKDQRVNPRSVTTVASNTSGTNTIEPFAGTERTENCQSELDRLEEKFTPVMEMANLLYKKQPKVPGYPGWFSDVCERDRDGHSYPTELGLSKAVVPKLLRLSWMGYPLHRHKDEKWGYLGNFPVKILEDLLSTKGLNGEYKTGREDLDIIKDPPDRSGFLKKAKADEEDGVMELPEAPGCLFIKLPHKDGKELRVGNPLSKSFLGKVRDGVLATESGHLAEKVLQAGKMVSYWKSNRERIADQMVISNCIIPQLVSAGTLTRRAVERTWLTASNAKVDRVGSELKCMVQAPPGYHFVGADVDSQELWIAAIFGDSQFVGEHGCTALGWMTLQGTKSAGTDMHSITARSVGVSRDQAKVLNYGRIYGAGVPFAKQLLQTFNPSLSDSEASRLASKMYSETKGERNFKVNKLGAICLAISQVENDRGPVDPSTLIGTIVSKKEMPFLLNTKLKLDKFVAEVKIGNGVPKFRLNESGLDLVHQLGLSSTSEWISLPDVTTFFKSAGRMSVASGRNVDVWKEKVSQLSSKQVWTGGTESHTFNRLEEIALDWKAQTPVLGCQISRVLYGIDGRFVISIHDEVRYLVKSEDRYRAALALQISNLLVRAIFCKRVGLNSLPRDVAFFSGVDVDKVMRKDPFDECITPSNQQGLSLGYGIKPGECLTMQEIIDKTNGSLFISED